MQNKGAVQLLAILLVLVCIYQLSFTWRTNTIKKNAREYANGDVVKENYYLDSIAGEVVYNFFYMRKYTYLECQQREINLGLDLKGGMSVTLEVSVVEVVKALSNFSEDSLFVKSIELAKSMQKSSNKDFVTLFGNAFNKLSPDGKLAQFFYNNPTLKGKIDFTTSNNDVVSVLKKETDGAIENAYKIIGSRIDRFGVVQPIIQKIEGSDRIMVELPGIKNTERARKLLQSTAKLEFWETYENGEVYQYLEKANKIVKNIKDGIDSVGVDSVSTDKLASDAGLKEKKAEIKKDSVVKDTTSNDLALLKEIQKADTGKKDSAGIQNAEQFANEYPLFAILRPNVTQDNKLVEGAAVGIAQIKDMNKIDAYLNHKQVKALMPKDIRFYWAAKPLKQDKSKTYYELYAIKAPSRDGKAKLDGDVIVNAREDFSQSGGNAEVSMTMNGKGSKVWARMTKDNLKKCIAIVLDDRVYSAPRVQSEITGGSSQISGDFTLDEAKDLATVLKSGKLPAPTVIVEEQIVGPTLGKESIQNGLISFIIAFVLILVYMQLYYNKAGLVANLALLTNIFVLFGVLASISAVLTLPGIAGIVLTMGMAVDANVIIYERIREELRAGKGIKLAVSDGFKHAYSAIIDGNVTTIITGVVLYIFGSGPIQGFATTLIIGILTSLFTAIFISRLVFEWMLNSNMNVTFDNAVTRNWFTKTKLPFINIRKKLYIVSLVLLAIGLFSMFTKGLNYGIDFTGGRTYVVRFDKDVTTNEVRNALAIEFGQSNTPEVKSFGATNQVKITSKYLINDEKADTIIENKLYNGLKGLYKEKLTSSQFLTTQETMLGIVNSQKVGPTIADDIKVDALLAIFFALIAIFIYIAIRFRNWQWGLGGVISLFHDSLITIGVFSIFNGILPFNLEVDQAFIAAILTIIGYSINDSVIIFDRIREYRTLYPKKELNLVIDEAINSTLGRTFNTSMTTIVTLIAIFIFGGDVIRGFTFALLFGIAIGTYSSVFNATPLAYDFILWSEKRKAKKEALKR